MPETLLEGCVFAHVCGFCVCIYMCVCANMLKSVPEPFPRRNYTITSINKIGTLKSKNRHRIMQTPGTHRTIGSLDSGLLALWVQLEWHYGMQRQWVDLSLNTLISFYVMFFGSEISVMYCWWVLPWNVLIGAQSGILPWAPSSPVGGAWCWRCH